MSFGISAIGALRYETGEDGVLRATRGSGPMAIYRPGLLTIGRSVSLNSAVNWADPNNTLAYIDGKLATVRLLDGSARALGIEAMTAEQLMDLSVLHEIRHSFGPDHRTPGSEIAFDKVIWENCLK